MEKIYLDENILIVKNFISQEDIDTVLLDFRDDENWTKMGVFYQKAPQFCSEETQKLLTEKFKVKVEEIINDDLNTVNWQTNLQKYENRPELEWAINPHPDRFSSEEYGAGESTSAYVTKGYILYFNNDYEGGEVVYVNKDITVKPEAGMLLVHSGYEEYKHGVKSVKSGERYFITGFVYEKEWFSKNS